MSVLIRLGVRGIPLWVGFLAAVVYFPGLGQAPFIDPPEGFHAEIARVMASAGDWITPHVNGVRYFDKPPVPYWLMGAIFSLVEPTPGAARLWTAAAGVGCAALTAAMGVLLGGPRLGLLAGLMVVANLGMFIYGRVVKPDMLLIFWITLAWSGFVLAYRSGRRWPLALFYGGLGVAAITKDFLGALGPLAALALFLWITRERACARWVPWWGVGLLLVVAAPWYLAVEAANRGFLWYTVVDNHLLNVARQRVFPDEDVPLGALEFLAVNVVAFLPWTLALPWAAARALRRDAGAAGRPWTLFALWTLLVLGLFTLSPFKLPHYGLPAFPAMALLVARVWEESITAAPRSVSPARLLAPILVLFVALAVLFTVAAAGHLPVSVEALKAASVTSRNLAARGQIAPQPPVEAYVPTFVRGAVVFGFGALALGLATWRRWPAVGVAAALATTMGFLPLAADGMALFARARSAQPIATELVERLRPDDVVIHEGALENAGAVLLTLRRPVRVVNGLQSNLAFGATFPEAREVFWDEARLRAEWAGPGRRFLVTREAPERSVVRQLPPGSVHLVLAAGGRRLYANVAD